MHPLLNNPLSGGCAFPPVAASLRLPAASLPCRSAGRSNIRRRPCLARASSDGSDGAAAGAVTEGEGGGGAGQRGASAESSTEKPPPPVNPKIEKELKKSGYIIREHTDNDPPAFLRRQFRRPRRRLRRGRPLPRRTPPCPEALYTPSLRHRDTPPCLWAERFPSTSCSPPTSRTFGGSWGCGPSGCSVTVPSLRARDCSNKEKEALNYLFILVPLINAIVPFFVKSFAVVWSADTAAFFLMYAWKLGWLQRSE